MITKGIVIIMRILHTSDLHLGISLNGKSYLGYQKLMAEELCRISAEHNADVVIIAGDIYDNALSRAEAIGIYNSLVTELCLKLNKQVIICAGNHDGAERLASCSELLKACGLHLYGRISADFAVPLEIGDCRFYVLPYFNRDEIKALLPEEDTESPEAAMRAVVGRLSPDPDRTNVLVAHCFVTGGTVSDSDAAARIGGSAAVSGEIFREFDYVALGHLHKPQWITPKIRYSGTPLKYSFSEAEQLKTVTIFDTGTGTFEEIPISQPVNLREISDSYENLLAAAETDVSPKDFMKIHITDRFFGQDALEKLRGFYPNLLHLDGIPTFNERAEAISAEEIAKLSTEELAARFYEEKCGAEISEKQLEWFRNSIPGGGDLE